MWAQLFHIETIFFIFLAIIIIYIWWKKIDISKMWVIDSISKNNNINTKKFENKCREIFEKIYKVEFPSVRPSWLKNPITKSNLELDGYNPTVATCIGNGLAFEYDGIQHSRYTPHFHRNGERDFLYQVEKDRFKDAKCREKNILLVRIPHFVEYNDLQDYIQNKITKICNRTKNRKF